MANEDLVALLKRRTEAWNAWRVQHREAVVDLSHAPLRGIDLARADLTGANLSGADLRGTVLTEARLVGACLQGANLFKAVLEGADMKDADLRGAQFLNCAQLQMALDWQQTLRDKDLACGAPLQSPEV